MNSTLMINKKLRKRILSMRINLKVIGTMSILDIRGLDRKGRQRPLFNLVMKEMLKRLHLMYFMTLFMTTSNS